MDLGRFSSDAFESLAGDPLAARRLADELRTAVLAAVGVAASERFAAVVTALNALGHRLAAFGPQAADDRHVRDYTDPSQCALRVGLDIVISVGYRDVRGEGGWGQLSHDERHAEPGAAADPAS